MTERKVIKVKKQAIRRARLKKVGTVAAMLPLVMSKGAPVATLIRGRHGEETVGIEQVVELSEQEIADVLLPEEVVEEVIQEEQEEYEIQETREEITSEPVPAFEAPQSFVAPSFSEGGLTSFDVEQASIGIAPLQVGNWDGRVRWPSGRIYSVQWLTEDTVRIEFSTRFPDPVGNLGTSHIEERAEFKVELDGVLSDIMHIANVRTTTGDRVFLDLIGIAPDAYGEVTIYGRDLHQGGSDSSFRLFGGVLRPNPHRPIVLNEQHIHRGTVTHKFVGDDVAVEDAEVIEWPHLDVSGLGFTGDVNFTSKIADIVFASTAQAGLSAIYYGTIDWYRIISEIEEALNRQDNLPAGVYYTVEIPDTLRNNFANSSLFYDAQVLENIPVAIENIHVNRGIVPDRAFNASRAVQSIERHITLDFDIQMARPTDRQNIMELEVRLPLDILLHDRPGLFASFVHIEGHNHFDRVFDAVVEAVEERSLELDVSLLQELTQSILTQSAVHDVNGNANGLYSGRMFIGDAEFVPTIIGNRQSVPDKTFDNTDEVVEALAQYTIEFAIMGHNPDVEGGILRYATARLTVRGSDLKFASSQAGRHQILVDADASISIELINGADDAFTADGWPRFLEEYGARVKDKIGDLAKQGGLFEDANIDPKQVTWTRGRVADKVYDGSTRVSSVVAPVLEGFVPGDRNIITFDFNRASQNGDTLAPLAERLRFADSLPGEWAIHGLDFHGGMLNRQDQVSGNIFNYEIVGVPEFDDATISQLILDVDDLSRLDFEAGRVSRQYNGTTVYDYSSLSPINVTIEGVENGENIYQFTFYDTFDTLTFERRHVTNGYVPVRVTTAFGLKHLGIPLVPELQPIHLSPELQDVLRDKLYLGEITPRQVFWGFGEVADKDYDGNDYAEMTERPQLFARYPTRTGDFGIYEGDKGTGADRVQLEYGTVHFTSENVAFNEDNFVTAQPVFAQGGWTIGGGYYKDNYELVARPDPSGIAGFRPANLFSGQSAFEMPSFVTLGGALTPGFLEATIHQLEVEFAGGALNQPNRTYTGMPIEPEIDEFSLPTLRARESGAQVVLDRDLASGRVEPVPGGFIHRNNREVGPAFSDLDMAWRLAGTHPSNYRLSTSGIEWSISAQQITSWESDQVSGALSGRAAKRFDDTDDFLDEHLLDLPRLGTVENAEGDLVANTLDITDWDLLFYSPDVGEGNSLTIENPNVVRQQLNDLIGPNQVLHDDFDFNSLFEAHITPRVLTWSNGQVLSRDYDGTTTISGEVILPSLVASEVGHEILNNHVRRTFTQSLLDDLAFPNEAPGTHTFDWRVLVELDVEFSESRHAQNYVVREAAPTFATIFPADFNKSEAKINFSVDDREYDGLSYIAENSFIAEIVLNDDLSIVLPYHVEGLRFVDVNAGTDALAFEKIIFDEKYTFFDQADIEELQDRIAQEVTSFRDAQITPRRIAWSLGEVAHKEWDDTYAVHDIITPPELIRPTNIGNTRTVGEVPELMFVPERAIVDRDLEKVTVSKGWAQFIRKEVENDVPVNSDGEWYLRTTDTVEHPLVNYTFVDGDQPGFAPANIKNVSVTDVQPMPENHEDMEANVLYIQSGYVERQYNGRTQVVLWDEQAVAQDMKTVPVFALRNLQEQVISLSLDNLEELDVHFIDEHVAYDNGDITNKELITRIQGFTHESILLSAPQIDKIKALLFTGRITPWELQESDITDAVIALNENRTIQQVYNGGASYIVPEEPDLDNPGEVIKRFPELYIKIVETGEIIHIRFEDDYTITFGDRHAATEKPVTISGFYLDSRNVVLSEAFHTWMKTNLLTGTIIPKPISWTRGQVARRHYDGTDNASIVAAHTPSLDILPIDDVTVLRGGVRFDEMNVRFDAEGNVIAMPVHATGEWGISGADAQNYQLMQPRTLRDSIVPTSQAMVQPFRIDRVQWMLPLFDDQIIDPVRISFNGRKIAERVFNYENHFMPEDKYYEYGQEHGFAVSEKWTNADTGQVMDTIGDYYLTMVPVEQRSRLANNQPHVAEDELVFIDELGNEISREDVVIELRDEQGNLNRNYTYVFHPDTEVIGRITKAQGFPVTQPQAARVEETEIELFQSQLMPHQFIMEGQVFLFEPFAFREIEIETMEAEKTFAPLNAFDPGPYLIEYAVSTSENPERLMEDDWQKELLFTGLVPGTEYFLFARQADHHNRYAGEIISGATVLTLGEAPKIPDNGQEKPTDPENGGNQGEHPEGPHQPSQPPLDDGSADGEYRPLDDEEGRTVEEEIVAIKEISQENRSLLPTTGDRLAATLGIAGLIALASAVILRKKNKEE